MQFFRFTSSNYHKIYTAPHCTAFKTIKAILTIVISLLIYLISLNRLIQLVQMLQLFYSKMINLWNTKLCCKKWRVVLMWMDLERYVRLFCDNTELKISRYLSRISWNYIDAFVFFGGLKDIIIIIFVDDFIKSKHKLVKKIFIYFRFIPTVCKYSRGWCKRWTPKWAGTMKFVFTLCIYWYTSSSFIISMSKS